MNTDNRRPMTDVAFWIISNGHIAASGHSTHFMYVGAGRV